MSAADSPPASRQPSRSGIGAIGVLLIVIVVAALGFLAWWQIEQAKAGAANEVAALRARLASDEARLATLQKSAQSGAAQQGSLAARIGKLERAPDGQARLDADERRLADLDLRIAALEHNAPAADLPQRIAAIDTAQAALTGRVAKLETADPALTMQRAAAGLALANLVRASAAGPFPSDLKTFQTLMPEAREADALIAIAPHGAPAEADLAARFPDVAAKALAAERAGSAKTWLERLWASLANVVVIRRIGDAKGPGSEAVLARAGLHLKAGDLAGAVAEMRALKGPAATSAQSWLADAQARLTIDRTVAALAARMAKALAKP